MMLLTLILAAAPVVLEPDAGGAHRLHPRRVTASSFLENGWNKYEQNYLPLYVADDDPTTAWVEGAKGRGEGEALEWWGPSLSRAKSFRVFLRNGFQKSDKLFRANARLRKVRVEPLRQGETGAESAGAAMELELKDVQGWQEVRVPVQGKVAGLRLTIASVYPGTAYDDTCLSDLRVYVEGDDPYRPEVEAEAFEQVRRFAYERRVSADRQGSQAKLEWAPRYRQEELASFESKNGVQAFEDIKAGFAAIPKKDAYQASLDRARAAYALFQRVDLNLEGPASEARKSWARVRPALLKPQKGVARVALSAMEDDGLVRASGLLHLGDVAFFEADATQAQMRAKLKTVLKTEAKAQAACVKSCEQERKKEPTPEGGWDFSCDDECSGVEINSYTQGDKMKHQLNGGDFVLGAIAHPTHYLRGLTEDTGEREATLAFRQTLVAYTGDRADTVVTWNGDTNFPLLRVHVLDWSEANGRSRVASITTFEVSLVSTRVLRYRPANA